MLAFIEITIGLFSFAGVVVIAAAIGFLAKSAKVNSTKQAINRLENEMLLSHAEILRLQKELAGKENQQSQAPIVPIRENNIEPAKDNLPDTGIRKKLLSGISKTKP
jgi:hypothetical protein